MLREQPLAVALAGLAAGAAVAAAFPRTEPENRTLGPAHDALTKAAAKAGENLMGAARRPIAERCYRSSQKTLWVMSPVHSRLRAVTSKCLQAEGAH